MNSVIDPFECVVIGTKPPEQHPVAAEPQMLEVCGFAPLTMLSDSKKSLRRCLRRVDASEMNCALEIAGSWLDFRWDRMQK